MSFLRLMTVKAHEEAVADLVAGQAEQRTYWRKDVQAERETVGRLIKDKALLLREVSDLRAELAPLKAERERRLAPLAAANERRRADKLAREAIPY